MSLDGIASLKFYLGMEGKSFRILWLQIKFFSLKIAIKICFFLYDPYSGVARAFQFIKFDRRDATSLNYVLTSHTSPFCF